MRKQRNVERVLIVDDWAHRPWGHFPNRFAELADGFDELGITVATLTSRGWTHRSPHHADWPVYRYGVLTEALARLAFLIEFRSAQRGRSAPFLTDTLRTLAALVAASRCARRMDRAHGDGFTAIVLLNYRCNPPLVALAARRPWLIHLFRERITGARLASTRPSRVRRAPVAVAIPSESWWMPTRRSVPALRAVLLRLAGTRRLRTDRPHAAASFGLRADLPTVLLFGTDHDQHHPAPAISALRSRTDVQLLIVGTITRLVSELPGGDQMSTWPVPPVLVPGHVDEATRDLAYGAADLVLLSFQPGYDRNSGTLMDALSYRLPVLVSDRSRSARVVTECGVGEVFAAGNEASLASALDRLLGRIGPTSAPADPLAGNVEAARARFSNRSIAAAHLEVLRRLGDATDRLEDWATELRP